MNIAIIGSGKMGQEVRTVADERKVYVSKVIRRQENAGGAALTPNTLRNIDVCIDFSVPDAAIANISAVAACGKNIVVGTTGWYDQMEQVKEIIRKNNTGLLYASNFSVGVNLFMKIVGNAAHLFDDYPQYDVALSETHHNKKIDAPSGTALTLGSLILENINRKSEFIHGAPDGAILPHQLQITSARVGAVMGTHSIKLDSEFDSIELTHTAKNRRGFALGAVMAAEWLNGKTGFYTMQDVIEAKGDA